jgi:ABC-2 type transport system permease protein
MTANSPIADLSYRNYDGPLAPTNMRWWVIAKSTCLTAMRKKSIWIAMTFSAWYYIAMIFVLYFTEQFQQARPPGRAPAVNFAAGIIWKDQFVIGFSYGQIMYLVVALIVGAGAIANDNRSNALLVYLSKPCTKLDYILGKWVGVFLTLLTVMTIPAMMFFAYGAMSYRAEGFFWADPWLFPQMLLMLITGAAIYSSLIIGVSSLFNQGRLAGATFAGVYFVSNFFSLLMLILYLAASDGGGGRRHRHAQHMSDFAHALTGNLSYCSIDGLNIGMAKAFFGTNGSVPFGLPGNQPMVAAPPLFLMLGIVIGVCALSLFVAWTRIRAVEIVG